LRRPNVNANVNESIKLADGRPDRMITNAIARRLDAIQQKSAMRSVDVANLLGTRPETVSRWNQGKAFPRPDAQKLLLDLEFIVDQLSDFYEPQEARLWLFSRQKLLEGERPAELIQSGRAQEVIEVIDRLRDGVFV
jgi:DNA-binding transcriptional regulator YiaG